MNGEPEPAPAPAPQEGETPEQLAITPGTAVVATTTIDALMTAAFATRSADLSGTPTYTWARNDPPMLVGTWPSSTTQSGVCAQVIARFEAHSVLPSTVGP